MELVSISYTLYEALACGLGSCYYLLHTFGQNCLRTEQLRCEFLLDTHFSTDLPADWAQVFPEVNLTESHRLTVPGQLRRTISDAITFLTLQYWVVTCENDR